MEKMQIIELLKKDVVPALGCTEPVCVALCSANAAREICGEIKSIDVKTNAGIYKNGMSAGIPNCSEVGLPWAAAIGAVLRNPEKSLQLLEDLNETQLEEAAKLVSGSKVKVGIDESKTGLYVECLIKTESEESRCVISGAHTNIVLTEKDGKAVYSKEESSAQSGSDPVVDELKEMTLAEIRSLVDSCSGEELAFLMDGVEMNNRLAAYSENTSVGVGLAETLRSEKAAGLLGSSLLQKILVQVTSAAESRLDGCPLPTMSSSGAGTKGLVVILPISETAEALSAGQEETVRALAFGHLVNRYINAHIGKLSPMCSCVMASSTAASAGIAYLLGGSDEQIGHAVRNMCGTVTGMICDGGKVGCALKVSTGSAAALISAVTAVNGAALRPSDGICAETPEDCIRNMARIGIKGMEKTDWEILDIMSSK